MARFFFLLLVAALLGAPVHAQSTETEPTAADTTATENDASWLVLPFASYAPDTKLAGGGVMGYYRPEQADEAASSVQTTITVTQRRQLIAQVTPELYLHDSQWRVQGDLQVSHFPNSFFGIGGNTPAAVEESFTARYVLVDFTAQQRIRPHLRIGPRVVTRLGTVTNPEDGGLIDRGHVPGADGGFTAGLGASAFWDTRNSRYYPTTGSYADVVATLHSATWGSEYTFGRFKSDLRGYRAPGPGVLAGQIYAEAVIGEAPFELLPLLGGSNRLRGYREGRFRDDVYWTAQAEYRIPLFWRFKGTAFAAVGEVGSRIGPSLVEDVAAAVGLGGRLQFTDDGVHGRLDVAYGRSGPELYVSLGEAF